MKQQKKNSVHLSDRSIGQLREISQQRKDESDPIWTHQNIVHRLIENAHKKEVKNAKSN